VATNDNPVTRYLTSTKNLAGAVGGIIGLIITFLGVAGPYWPVVIIGLYAAGVFAAPPEKISLVLEDAEAETGRLRRDLGRLTAEVRQHSSRIPHPALAAFGRIAELLGDVLDRPDALTVAPDQMHAIARAVRTDLPESLQSYLNLPWWYAAGRRINGQPTAAEELTTQLELLEKDLTGTADQVYQLDAQRLRDQTRYLRDRTKVSGLESPGDPAVSGLESPGDPASQR
jgi:hypothetical protein